MNDSTHPIALGNILDGKLHVSIEPLTDQMTQSVKALTDTNKVQDEAIAELVVASITTKSDIDILQNRVDDLREDLKDQGKEIRGQVEAAHRLAMVSILINIFLFICMAVLLLTK